MVFSAANYRDNGYSNPVYSRSFGEDGVKASPRRMHPSCHRHGGSSQGRQWVHGGRTPPFALLVNPHVIVDELRATEWKSQGVVTVQEVASDDGRFVLNFVAEGDRWFVLKAQLWHYRRDGVIFVEFDGKGDPTEVDFGVMAIWAQVRNLPFKLKTESIGRTLGDELGEVLEGQGANKRALKFGSFSSGEKFPSAGIDNNNTDDIVIKVATAVSGLLVAEKDAATFVKMVASTTAAMTACATAMITAAAEEDALVQLLKSLQVDLLARRTTALPRRLLSRAAALLPRSAACNPRRTNLQSPLTWSSSPIPRLATVPTTVGRRRRPLQHQVPARCLSSIHGPDSGCSIADPSQSTSRIHQLNELAARKLHIMAHVYCRYESTSQPDDLTQVFNEMRKGTGTGNALLCVNLQLFTAC
ncbi:retroelement [Hordeum vulgare]|nr:retroelement [Hordeum vulgare]